MSFIFNSVNVDINGNYIDLTFNQDVLCLNENEAGDFKNKNHYNIKLASGGTPTQPEIFIKSIDLMYLNVVRLTITKLNKNTSYRVEIVDINGQAPFNSDKSETLDSLIRIQNFAGKASQPKIINVTIPDYNNPRKLKVTFSDAMLIDSEFVKETNYKAGTFYGKEIFVDNIELPTTDDFIENSNFVYVNLGAEQTQEAEYFLTVIRIKDSSYNPILSVNLKSNPLKANASLTVLDYTKIVGGTSIQLNASGDYKVVKFSITQGDDLIAIPDPIYTNDEYIKIPLGGYTSNTQVADAIVSKLQNHDYKLSVTQIGANLSFIRKEAGASGNYSIQNAAFTNVQIGAFLIVDFVGGRDATLDIRNENTASWVGVADKKLLSGFTNNFIIKVTELPHRNILNRMMKERYSDGRYGFTKSRMYLNSGNLIPFSKIHSLFTVLTSNIGDTLRVTVHSLGEIQKGKTTLPTNQTTVIPINYESNIVPVFVPRGKALVSAENLNNGQVATVLVSCTNYGLWVDTLANEIYKNIDSLLSEIDYSLNSPFSTTAAIPILSDLDLFPNVQSLQLLFTKMSILSYLAFPGSDYAIRALMTVYTQNTPLSKRTICSYNFDPSHIPIFNLQEDAFGNEFHVWYPDLNFGVFCAFTKLIQNLDGHSPVSLTDESATISIDGINRYFNFDFDMPFSDYLSEIAVDPIRIIMSLKIKTPISIFAPSYRFDYKLAAPYLLTDNDVNIEYENNYSFDLQTEFTNWAADGSTKSVIDSTSLLSDASVNFGAKDNYVMQLSIPNADSGVKNSTFALEKSTDGVHPESFLYKLKMLFSIEKNSASFSYTTDFYNFDYEINYLKIDALPGWIPSGTGSSGERCLDLLNKKTYTYSSFWQLENSGVISNNTGFLFRVNGSDITGNSGTHIHTNNIYTKEDSYINVYIPGNATLITQNRVTSAQYRFNLFAEWEVLSLIDFVVGNNLEYYDDDSLTWKPAGNILSITGSEFVLINVIDFNLNNKVIRDSINYSKYAILQSDIIISEGTNNSIYLKDNANIDIVKHVFSELEVECSDAQYTSSFEYIRKYYDFDYEINYVKNNISFPKPTGVGANNEMCLDYINKRLYQYKINHWEVFTFDYSFNYEVQYVTSNILQPSGVQASNGERCLNVSNNKIYVFTGGSWIIESNVLINNKIVFKVAGTDISGNSGNRIPTDSIYAFNGLSFTITSITIPLEKALLFRVDGVDVSGNSGSHTHTRTIYISNSTGFTEYTPVGDVTGACNYSRNRITDAKYRTDLSGEWQVLSINYFNEDDELQYWDGAVWNDVGTIYKVWQFNVNFKLILINSSEILVQDTVFKKKTDSSVFGIFASDIISMEADSRYFVRGEPIEEMTGKWTAEYGYKKDNGNIVLQNVQILSDWVDETDIFLGKWSLLLQEINGVIFKTNKWQNLSVYFKTKIINPELFIASKFAANVVNLDMLDLKKNYEHQLLASDFSLVGRFNQDVYSGKYTDKNGNVIPVPSPYNLSLDTFIQPDIDSTPPYSDEEQVYKKGHYSQDRTNIVDFCKIAITPSDVGTGNGVEYAILYFDDTSVGDYLRVGEEIIASDNSFRGYIECVYYQNSTTKIGFLILSRISYSIQPIYNHAFHSVTTPARTGKVLKSNFQQLNYINSFNF